MILCLSLVTHWRFQKFRLLLPEVESPNIVMPEINLEWEDTLFPENEEKREWVSPGGKLKLTHSASWQEMGQSLLEQANEGAIILPESETLFFAHWLKAQEQAFAILTVSRVSDEKNLEEMIEEIKQSIENEGGETEIISSEIRDRIARLEMISKYPDDPGLYSKGQIISSGKEVFLIFLTSPQKDWAHFKEEAEEILDSVQLIE